MSFKAVSVLLFSSILTVACIAQPLQDDYVLYTERDGLPHNNVLCLLQDSYGFLWIGTYNGLCIYDGYKFQPFANVFTGQQDSWEYIITALHEDEDQNIWVVSRGGFVSCFIRKEQRFKQYNDVLVQNNITSFLRDKSGRLWLGCEDGYITWIINKNIIKEKIISRPIKGIVPINKNMFRIFSETGVYEYYFDQKKLEKPKDNHVEFINDIDYNEDFTAVLHGASITILKSNPDPKIITTKIKKVESATYYRVTITNDGYFYTDGSNIYKYNKQLELVNQYHISDNVNFNKNEKINDIIIDHSGILWIATVAGLYMLDLEKQNFKKYSIGNRSGKITHNYVRTIYSDSKKTLWLGFKNGMINQLKYDPAYNQYIFKRSYNIHQPTKTRAGTYTINTFLEKKDGSILAAGEAGIFQIANNGKAYELDEKDLHNIYEIWALYEDNDKNIWIGTNHRGLFIYNTKQQKLYQYKYNKANPNAIKSNSIWYIYTDTKDRVWLCTDKGLHMVENPENIADLKFITIPLSNNDSCSVWNVIQDQTGMLWVGTIGSGLYSMPVEDVINTKRVTDIPENNIASTIVDKHNNLWLSTTNGLYRYDPKKHIVNHFTEENGLAVRDFNFNSAEINDSMIFLGTKTGMLSFKSTPTLQNAEARMKPAITSIFVEGDDSTSVIYKNNILDLQWDKNDFSIGFALLDYRRSAKAKFRYKLEGYNTDWVYLPSNHNQAVFTNVPPGQYQFVVESSNNYTNWGNSTNLKIKINPAFWQKTLFKLLVLVLSLLLTVSLIRWRFVNVITKERTKAELEKRIALLELKALRAQMNPHFIFNTLNSIQHFILNHNEREANAYLSKFAQLMRFFLESSRNRYVSLNDELDMLRIYLSLEQLRFEDYLDYTIKVDEKISVDSVQIPSMLLQPFLENAIKHGLANKKGQLLLIISKNNDIPGYIKCIIDDNGIGRKKAAETNNNSKHISRGIKLIEDRIKTYNFIEGRKITLKIIDKVYPEHGTIVEITIPVNNENISL